MAIHVPCDQYTVVLEVIGCRCHVAFSQCRTQRRKRDLVLLLQVSTIETFLADLPVIHEFGAGSSPVSRQLLECITEFGL